MLHLLLLGINYNQRIDGTWFVLLLSLILAGTIPQWVWWRKGRSESWHYPVTELVVTGLFLFYAVSTIHTYFSYIAIPAMCAAANVHSARLRIPLWFWFSIVPALVMAAALPISSFNISIIEGLFFFGLGCVVWKMVDTHRKMQTLLEENDKQRQVLEQYAKQIETITLLEERNRLARELHDTVGHTLTSVIVGLDAVSYTMKVWPEEAKQSVDHLRTIARSGLEEMRRHVHHIAPSKEGLPLSKQLREIADEFAVHTGTWIDFESAGPEISIPLPLTLTLVRCLQESLTNAKRHGNAEHILITLASEADRLILTVRDDGCGMEEVCYGFGLSVMEERLSAYQGELQVTSERMNGTTIRCQLPLKTRKAG